MNQAALITFITSLTLGLHALWRENGPATKLSDSRGRLCWFKMQEFIKLRIFYDFVNISPPIFSTFSFDPLGPASPSLPPTAKACHIQKLSSFKESECTCFAGCSDVYLCVCMSIKRHVYHCPQWFVVAQAVALTAEVQIWDAQQESTMHLISQQLLTNRGHSQPADEKERVNTQVTWQFKSVDCACIIRNISCSKVSL